MDTRGIRPAPTTLAFHASRIVTDVGVLLVLGAMSLPFVTSAAGNRSAMALDAFPTLVLVAPIFVVTLIPDHTRPLPRSVGWGALVLGLAALPYALVKYLDAAVLADTLDGSVGMGARLLVFGTFVTVVGIGIGMTRGWMGLPSGGTPGRRAAIRTRQAPKTGGTMPQARTPAAAGAPRSPAPARTATAPAEESPFGGPLFDSLEVPAVKKDEPAPQPQPTIVFDQDGAADRVADEEPRKPRRDEQPGS